MPTSQPALRVRQLDKTLYVKRYPLDMEALMDHKETRALQGRNPRPARLLIRSRWFPWRVSEDRVHVWHEGDTEPLDMDAEESDWHADRRPRITKALRNAVSRDSSGRAIMRGAQASKPSNTLGPIIITAEIIGIGAMLMIGWVFLSSQGTPVLTGG